MKNLKTQFLLKGYAKTNEGRKLFVYSILTRFIAKVNQVKKTRLIALALLMVFASCSKTEIHPTAKQLASMYYYKVSETDLDGNMGYTQVLFIHTNNNATNDVQSSVPLIGVMDNSHTYCHGDNVNSAKCKMMPVTFVNVGINYSNYAATIYWTAAIEFNVNHYQIWRSTGQNTWEVIATLPPLGQGTNYTYKDVLQ